jgi:hypothetical protein
MSAYNLTPFKDVLYIVFSSEICLLWSIGRLFIVTRVLPNASQPKHPLVLRLGSGLRHSFNYDVVVSSNRI